MPAMLVAKVKINDAEAYREYLVRSGPAVKAFGGRFVVRGTPPEMLEGEDDGLRTVLVEFPDIETARAWHRSQQYAEARAFRAPPVADAAFFLFETS